VDWFGWVVAEGLAPLLFIAALLEVVWFLQSRASELGGKLKRKSDPLDLLAEFGPEIPDFRTKWSVKWTGRRVWAFLYISFFALPVIMVYGFVVIASPLYLGWNSSLYHELEIIFFALQSVFVYSAVEMKRLEPLLNAMLRDLRRESAEEKYGPD
jgi:hypothetical protein